MIGFLNGFLAVDKYYAIYPITADIIQMSETPDAENL
jgi:hypothetical protein